MTANPRLKEIESQPNECTIFVEGLEFYAYHGVPDAEQSVGHRYQIDLFLTVRTESTATDLVEDSVDYGQVAQRVTVFAQSTQYRTVERLAQSIIDLLFLEYERIIAIRIRLAKRLPPAPIIAQLAGIELHRHRI